MKYINKLAPKPGRKDTTWHRSVDNMNYISVAYARGATPNMTVQEKRELREMSASLMASYKKKIKKIKRGVSGL